MSDDKNPLDPPNPLGGFGEEKAQESKKKSGVEITTVAEAKAALSSAKDDGDNYVWGTRITRGSRKDFEATLQAMSDSDAIVWGT